MGTQGAPAPQPAAEKASTCSPERPHAEEPNLHPSCTHQPHLGCSDLRDLVLVNPRLPGGFLRLHRSTRRRRYKNPDHSCSEQIL